jgi:hypothetical protein
MIKFDIKNRSSGDIQFTAEIDCPAEEKTSVKLGLSVRWAIKSGISLICADLRNADLSDADLSYADLSYANLSYANLRNANLSDADLSYANLSDADLICADLRNADLSDADLIIFQGFGSRYGIFYAYKNKDNIIEIRTGCFFGTINEFIKCVKKEHNNNNFGREYLMICDLIKLKFGVVNTPIGGA